MRIPPEMLKGPSPEADASWRRFLHPGELRNNLIMAAIYISSFETLKTTIIERIRDFFCHGFDQTGFLISEEYKTKVLTLDPKGNVLKASLAWLKQMSAINDDDLAKFKQITDLRNEIAHELVGFAAKGIPAHCEERMGDMIRLLHKIEVWWVRNVDMEIDPEFADPDVKDEDIQPGTVITLQMMAQIALGSEKEAQVYFDEYVKRFGSSPEKPRANP